MKKEPKNIFWRTPRKLSALSRVTGLSGLSSQLWSSNKRKQSLKDGLKLCCIVLPPLIATGALAYLEISSSYTILSDLELLRSNVDFSENIRHLVTALGAERGVSCAYLKSERNGSEVANRTELEDARLATDSAANIIVGEIQFPWKEWRVKVNNLEWTCDTVLSVYSNEIHNLIGRAGETFKSNTDGPFWLGVMAFHAIIVAKDYTGIQRALGAVYFAGGHLDPDSHTRFIKLGAASERLLEIANSSLQEAGQLWTDLQNQTEQTTLGILENIVMENSFGVGNTSLGLEWFSIITAHIDQFGQVETFTEKYLKNALQAIKQKASTALTADTVIVAVAGVVCSALTVSYAVQSKYMKEKIGQFTAESQAKSANIAIEKQRSEVLLHQMLPTSVAKALKERKPVPPEFFSSVSIYFSDVVGFTILSSKSTPNQIVDLLNALYGTWDSTLDQYDCYKVETIGDAYMVASGIPQRNGENHSAVIATLALHLLLTMDRFQIPHMQTEKLLVRIGIHTGPVCAGVVGAKMPRYCLFGETVTGAAAMESSGAGQRIHVSEVTERHLELHHPETFLLSPRTKNSQKNTTGYSTFWLLEKTGFPYKVDLAEAEEIVKKARYNKL